MTQCAGCRRRVTENQRYVTCDTCGAVSHLGCDSHCIFDDIAPNRVGDGRVGAMLRDATQAKGMGAEDLARLIC